MADSFFLYFLTFYFRFQIEDDDHDSGTESDDEHGATEEPDNSELEIKKHSLMVSLSPKNKLY